MKQQIPVPDKPKPIAIIGGGGIIRDAHLPAYSNLGFEVLGILDSNYDKAESLKNEFPIVERAYNSLSELIEEAGRRGAIFDLAVPAGNILPILKQIPDFSPILIQKPMGETWNQAKAIFELCKEKHLVSAVNFQLRFAPYILAAKDMIGQGLLGDVFDIELKVGVYTPWQLWDFLKKLDRVEILYHSIHYLDLIRSFWGNPAKLYASTRKHPNTPELAATRSTIILDYDQKRQARIITNHGHDYGTEHQESYLKIEGTKGAIKIVIGVSLDYPKGQPPQMQYYLHNGTRKWEDVPLRGGWFPFAFEGSMTVLQNHVIDGMPLYHSTKDALETMRLVEAAYLSNQQGGITLDKIK